MFSTESFHGDGEVCGRKRLGRGRHPSFSDGNLPSSFNPFTPGILRKVRFLNILVIIRLDLGQITFNPVENAFATQQLAFLATNVVDSGIRRNKNFRLFDFWKFFFAFPFSPFLFFLLQWLTSYWAWLWLKNFSNFSGHHWKDLFLLQKLSIDDANFGQNWWRQKTKERRFVTGRYGRHRRQWTNLRLVERYFCLAMQTTTFRTKNLFHCTTVIVQKNPDFGFQWYDVFDVENMNSADCIADFRVEIKEDLRRLEWSASVRGVAFRGRD